MLGACALSVPASVPCIRLHLDLQPQLPKAVNHCDVAVLAKGCGLGVCAAMGHIALHAAELPTVSGMWPGMGDGAPYVCVWATHCRLQLDRGDVALFSFKGPQDAAFAS